MSGSDIRTLRVGVCGASDTGKSTLLAMIAAAVPTAWVLDPQHGHDAPSGGRLFRPDPAVKRDRSKGGRYYEEAEGVAQLALETGDVTVIFDESNTAVRRGHVGPPSIDTILHEGRHAPLGNPTGVSCVICCRRPFECPPSWWSQLAHLFVFRLTNKHDVDWAKDLGIPEKILRRLPRGAFFHINFERGAEAHLHRSVEDETCPPPVLLDVNDVPNGRPVNDGGTDAAAAAA